MMDNLETTKPEKQMIMIGNEAFGLLLLENLWDQRVDQYILSRGSVAKQKNCNIKGFNSKIFPFILVETYPPTKIATQMRTRRSTFTQSRRGGIQKA